jgi:hypothetical protein
MVYPSYFVNLGSSKAWIADLTNGYASVFLDVKSASPVSTLNDLFRQIVLPSIKNVFPGFRAVPGWESGKNGSLSSNPAIGIQWYYTGTDGTPWEGWRIDMVSGGHDYSLGYFAPTQYFNNYAPDVAAMVVSFKCC